MWGMVAICIVKRKCVVQVCYKDISKQTRMNDTIQKPALLPSLKGYYVLVEVIGGVWIVIEDWNSCESQYYDSSHSHEL